MDDIDFVIALLMKMNNHKKIELHFSHSTPFLHSHFQQRRMALFTHFHL